MNAGLPMSLQFRLLHVGVAVNELEPAVSTLNGLFGYEVVSGPFDDPIQKVRVTFLKASQTDSSEIELIAPLGTDSPIQSMLSKNGGGAYHICLETNDIEAAVNHARAGGCVVISQPVPAVAFNGRRIAWIFAPSRQLIELVEAKEADQSLAER